ncbi:hypothetical protein CWI36_0528p0010 [Hamiltosporidium magnivora]|uniref:Translation initiation factor eIF2B subunit gamma n=5 Tax=Hamiltosporidium TaxID=1176354 RepID=A0A4Q9LEX5_9MICR|nr:hypothetical protein CWI36_0528p0010 [Hamiltosporidium magnivora]
MDHKIESIILLGPGIDIFPITTMEYPKFTLRILNKPLLVHNIQWLEKKSSKIYIIGLEYYQVTVNNYLEEFKLSEKTEFIPISQYDGSVNSLLRICKKIKSKNILVTKGDIITNIDVSSILEEYFYGRCKIMTVLIRTNTGHKLMGYSGNNLVYYTVNSMDILNEKKFEMFQKFPNITFSTEMDTSQVYVLDKSLLEYEESFFSFKASFLPFLIENLREKCPVKVMRVDSGYYFQINSIEAFIKASLAKKQSSFIPQWILNGEGEIFEYKNCCRQTLKKISFKDQNEDVRNIVGKKFLPGDFYLYNSIIGNNCRIGKGTRILSSIILDNTKIGENCLIQDSIIGESVVICDRCFLKTCKIMPKYVFSEAIKASSEIFSLGEL